MSIWLVFEREADARMAEELITARGRQLFAAAGYAIDHEGVRAPTGSGLMRCWATVRQRADGRFCFPHPQSAAFASKEMAEAVLQPNLPPHTLEAFDPLWFPTEETF